MDNELDLKDWIGKVFKSNLIGETKTHFQFEIIIPDELRAKIPDGAKYIIFTIVNGDDKDGT